jgi:putative transposase
MSVSDAKRLKELESENGRLKKLLAESLLPASRTHATRSKRGGVNTTRSDRRSSSAG